MESILLNVTVGVFTIIAYTIGLKHGKEILGYGKEEKVAKQPKNTKKTNVMKTEQELKMLEEVEKLVTVLNNLENYDGTSNGQKEVR